MLVVIYTCSYVHVQSVYHSLPTINFILVQNPEDEAVCVLLVIDLQGRRHALVPILAHNQEERRHQNHCEKASFH